MSFNLKFNLEEIKKGISEASGIYWSLPFLEASMASRKTLAEHGYVEQQLHEKVQQTSAGRLFGIFQYG